MARKFPALNIKIFRMLRLFIKLKNIFLICTIYMYIHTHTNAHIHIYIYIKE